MDNIARTRHKSNAMFSKKQQNTTQIQYNETLTLKPNTSQYNMKQYIQSARESQISRPLHRILVEITRRHV